MIADLVGWIIIGAVAGIFAARLVGQESYTGYGPAGDFGFALGGALLGGVAARLLSVGGPATGNAFTWPSLVLAAIGTLIALGLARATSRQEERK